MTQFAKQQNDPRHLGDGAYASHDGYHIWVSADRDGITHCVAFEPGLIQELVRYEADIRRKYAPKEPQT
jgi:hypothetical protein